MQQFVRVGAWLVDRDILLVLITATVTLVATLAGTYIQHLLSLRAEEAKRERDREDERIRREEVRKEEEQKQLRQTLMAGVHDSVKQKVLHVTIGEDIFNTQAGLDMFAGFGGVVPPPEEAYRLLTLALGQSADRWETEGLLDESNRLRIVLFWIEKLTPESLTSWLNGSSLHRSIDQPEPPEEQSHS